MQIRSQNGGRVLSSMQCVFKCDVYVNVTAYPNIVIASKITSVLDSQRRCGALISELVILKCC